MFFFRAALVLAQAISVHRVFLPPNEAPKTGRYNAKEVFAPEIAKLHSWFLWCIAAFETIYALYYHFGPTLPLSLTTNVVTAICPMTRSHPLTPLFVAGVLLTIGGAVIRILCFQEMGRLFTFHLSILPGHKLVKSGPYKYVRHPSYTGAVLVVVGIAFSHMTAGSAVADCTSLGPVGVGLLWAVSWSWIFLLGISRAFAEDKQLRKQFRSEWDAYAATTKYWFVPGLL